MTFVTAELDGIAKAVASELVSVEMAGNSAVLSVPVLYPSGASAVVDISQHGDRFFVSDMGYGFQEAENFGATASFSRHAKSLADHFGVKFDNQSFFIAEASREALPSVVTIVANCSVEAANIAALKASEKKFVDDSDVIYRKLATVFPRENIARNAQIAGSSTHEWPVATLVTIDHHKAIFEPVAKHHNSVVNAAAKFHDIARLDNPPSRIVMVKNIIEMNDYINILSQAAQVIEFGASEQTIRRVAA